MATSGAPDHQQGSESLNSKKPISPPAANAWSGIGRKLGRLALALPLFAGWTLTKIGGAMFNVGADLETWARRKRMGNPQAGLFE